MPRTRPTKTERAAKVTRPASVENPSDDELPPHVIAAREHTGRQARQRIDNAADRAAEGEESDILDTIKGEIGTGAYCRLHRRKVTDSNFALIESRIPIENFTVEWVLTTFGGGDYRAEFRRSDNTFVKNYPFTIDHSIPSVHPREAKQIQAPQLDAAGIIDAVNKAKPGDNSMMPLILGMMDTQAKMFAAMVSGGRGGGGESKLLELLLPSLLQQKQTPVGELMDAFRNFKRLQSGDTTPEVDDDPEPPSMMEKLMGKDWMTKLIPVLTPVFESIAAQAAGVGGRPLVNVTPHPAARPTAAAPSTTAGNGAAAAAPTETPESPDMMLKIMMSQFRSSAIKAAQQGKDAYDFVQGLASVVPNEYHSKIYGIANAPDWFAQIFQADPEAAKHVEFLTAVRNAVLYLALGAVAMEQISAKATPPAAAKLFIEWVNKSFTDDLAGAVNDPEWFAEVFGEHYAPNKKWIDGLREAFANQLTEPKPIPSGPVIVPVPAGAGAAGKKV